MEGRIVTPSDIDARYAVAQEVIAEAADIALAYSRDVASLDIEAKGPQDLVSQADRQVEQHIRRRLTEAFPGDAFVGEETGRGGADGAVGAWVVDPIDGTQPFLLGLPFWSVSIAYVVGHDVLIGLVMNPSSGDLYAARKGGGAFVNGVPTHIIEATSLDAGVTGVGCSLRTHPDDLAHIMHGLLSQRGMYLRVGSGALNLAYVAAGQLIGYVEMHINAWDCAAALCICQEAGALANDFLGLHGITGGGALVVGAPGVYAALVGLLPPGTALEPDGDSPPVTPIP